MKTQIQRKTQIIDAEGQSLGRVAVKISDALRGKNKADYLPYLDQGDFVEVINTDRLKFAGKKLKQKKYMRHSGYLGHLKTQTLEELLEKKGSGEAVKRAVYDMMPDNKLRDIMIKRLKCYGAEK